VGRGSLKQPKVCGLSLCLCASVSLSQGMLQRAWKEPATGEEKWQMVVPKDLRDAVLEAMHGATRSGHFGVSKTLRRFRKGFYWDQCKRDVKDFYCAVTSVWHKTVPQVALTLHCSSFQWGHQWKGWQWMWRVQCCAQMEETRMFSPP